MSGNYNSTPRPGLQPAVDGKTSWQRVEPFPIAADPRKLKVAVCLASQCKTQLEAALAYASYGVPVIPCNFKPNEEGVLSKYPLLPSPGVYLASIDPTTIREWWAKDPKALIGVPGGWITGLWFTDVDSKEHGGEDCITAWFNLDKDGTARTRAHKTGTGGLHFIYLEDPNRPMGCHKLKLPEVIDIKGDGGYVIVPPSPYERNGATVSYSISDDIDPASAPDWLYDRILGPRPKGNGAWTGSHEWSEGFGQKKLNEICETVRTATKGHWDEARCKVFIFGRLVGGGAYDADQAWSALEKAAKACNAPEDYPREVKRAFFNGVAEPASPFIETTPLDDFRAYLPLHSYLYVPTRELWPAASVNARIPSVDPKVKASTWLDQHRAIEQMTWAPGEEMFISGRLMADGGWIEKSGVTCCNLYRPPTIKSGDSRLAGPWIDHVCKLFGSDAEHLFKWFAQRVQHPEVKINHALVLGSENQGTGKDTMLEPVKRAVGPWNFQEGSPQQVLGRFNSFLKSVVLRISEARDLGEINRYSFYDHMKAFTASPPDVLRVDEKHLQEHSILNCVGIILTTNYKFTGIYLPPEDRRHYVAWCNLALGDFAEGYWKKLWGWYDAGGDTHVATFLAEYDISDFDPKAPPPKTQAFWDIVDANRSSVDSELADVLDALDNPRAVTLQQVIGKADFINNKKLADWLSDPKNQRAIPHRFEQCDYVPVRNPNRQDKFWKIGGRRQVVYALSSLSLAEQLDAADQIR
jgi:hypothetical protein